MWIANTNHPAPRKLLFNSFLSVICRLKIQLYLDSTYRVSSNEYVVCDDLELITLRGVKSSQLLRFVGSQDYIDGFLLDVTLLIL